MATKKSAKLQLKKFAMVGTGIQGTQIAMIAARTGYEVTVFDPREGAFRQTFEKLRADLKASHFNLLEKLTEHIATWLLENFAAQWVRVSVAKLGMMPGVKRVGVIIERSI